MNHRRAADRAGGKTLPVLFLLIALAAAAAPVIAGAPPAEGRPGFLLPHLGPPFLNESRNSCFSVTDSAPSGHVLTPSPQLFGLSGHHAVMNISCSGMDDQYIAEVWYFSDWNEFHKQRGDLTAYLDRHGTAANVTLDISSELDGTGDPWVSGLKTRQVPAIRYNSRNTSGYFIIFSTGYFPGQSYYIAYYGIDGPSGPEDHDQELKTLVMAAVPGFLDGSSENVFNPEAPLDRPAAPLPASLVAAASAIAAGIRIILRRH